MSVAICEICGKRITWPEQRKLFGWLINRTGCSPHQAKQIMPRCRKCLGKYTEQLLSQKEIEIARYSFLWGLRVGIWQMVRQAPQDQVERMHSAASEMAKEILLDSETKMQVSILSKLMQECFEDGGYHDEMKRRITRTKMFVDLGRHREPDPAGTSIGDLFNEDAVPERWSDY